MFAFFLGASVFLIAWLFAWLKIDFALDRLSDGEYTRLRGESKLRDIRLGLVYVLLILVSLGIFTLFPMIPISLKLGFAGAFLIFIVSKFYAAHERVSRMSLGNDLRRAVYLGFSVLTVSYCFLVVMVSEAVLTIRIWR